MFDKEIRLLPAFDKRHPDPSKNYGIHGVEIVFILKGPEGAISLTIYTPMHLPHVAEEMWGKRTSYNALRTIGADVSYHSPTPKREDQEPHVNCDYLGGKDCYCDGSSLLADDLSKTLLTRGSDAVWEELEKFYAEWLGDGE